MRGREQHVERKIRLWVVQQERNRLRESQPERIAAQGDDGAEQRRLELDARAHERWRVS